MSARSEYPEVDPYTTQLVHEITSTGVGNGIPYTNILLTNEGMGLATGYDPDADLNTTHLAMHWPHGSPDGHRYENLILGEHHAGWAESISRVREIILGASVGSVALMRTHPITELTRELTKTMSGGSGVGAAMDLCGLANVPLGVVQIATVEHSTAMPEGATVGALWHPMLVHPKPVLAQMKQAIRRTIQEETI